MKKLLYTLCISAVFLAFGGAEAAETDAQEAAQSANSEPAEQEGAYAFPVIKPEIYVYGGYGFISTEGSERAAEYEYLHSSPAFGGELRMFSFPHRFHLDLNIKNKKDFFGDVTYMYKDVVRFRGISTSLFHNLENVRLIDLDPSTLSPGVDVRDADQKYGIRSGMNSVFLRFKTPDYPFHLYLDGSLIERNGSQQQRSLLGSGSFNNVVRASQSREIDMDTKNVTLGMNTHLGPVEIDLSHGEKRFSTDGDKVLYDFYSASAARAAGVFPHNMIPELKGSSNTIKLHTSYTGRLVGSATFSKIDRENTDSNVKADYFIGAGEISWMASPRLAVFLKYRHKEIDVDTPATVAITDRTNPLNSYIYPVEPAISSITDSAAAIVRYRPVSGVTVRAEYGFEDIRRTVSSEWDVPQSTQRNTLSLSTDIRVAKGVSLKARYAHKYIENPAYNYEPDNSDEGRMSVSWLPAPRLNTLLSYIVTREKRDDLRFTDTPDARNREVNRNRVLWTLTYLLMKDLSVTGSYSYMSDKTEQDIAFRDPAGVAQVDPFVPNTETMHNYGLDLTYLPKNNISLSTGVSYTISRGAFYPSDINLLQPVSIASFAQLKTKELACSLSGEYRFKGGFAAGVQYRYSNFDDVLDNPYDDVEDGRAHLILLTLSKRW